METTKKKNQFKYITYCLLIVAAGIIQNVSGLFPEIWGARCFFLIPVTIILIIGEDEKTAALIGLFSGLIWDMHSPAHMGFNCLFMMLACFLIGAVVSRILRDVFITNLIAAIGATVLYCLLYWLFFIIIKGVSGGTNLILSFYLPCALYTSILTPVFWLFLKPIKNKIEKL